MVYKNCVCISRHTNIYLRAALFIRELVVISLFGRMARYKNPALHNALVTTSYLTCFKVCTSYLKHMHIKMHSLEPSHGESILSLYVSVICGRIAGSS